MSDKTNILYLCVCMGLCDHALDKEETSEILNIPIGTVMSRLNEARKKLSGQKKNNEIKEVN